MAFPLATVLAATPGIISAAADIIKLVRNRKDSNEPQQQAEDSRVDELAMVIEKQAVLIEEMARSNRELALAVRNNRILSVVSIAVALLAVLAVFFQ